MLPYDEAEGCVAHQDQLPPFLRDAGSAASAAAGLTGTLCPPGHATLSHPAGHGATQPDLRSMKDLPHHWPTRTPPPEAIHPSLALHELHGSPAVGCRREEEIAPSSFVPQNPIFPGSQALNLHPPSLEQDALLNRGGAHNFWKRGPGSGGGTLEVMNQGRVAPHQAGAAQKSGQEQCGQEGKEPL